MIEPVWNVDGVPPLPAGYMYRVEKWSFGTVRVQLRKKRVIGSKKLSYVILVPREFETPEDMISWGCEKAIEKYNEDFDAELIRQGFRPYVGDHLSLEDK